jgi:hypothetical protein
MKRIMGFWLGWTVTVGLCAGQSADLWELGKANRDTLAVSTLFTAQDVRGHLSTDEEIDKAIAWCKATGVTRVFIEEYRDKYWAQRPAIEKARDRFRAAGIAADGCVTTTQIGKSSGGWGGISCFTDKATQDEVQKIFEFSASMFDLIMIDDFWFTDCKCDECAKAKGNLSWGQYRCELMDRVSRERILEPARKVNPKVKIIIKYPQWYEDFHNRGYDVVTETRDFDWIWVGTETRDYKDKQWGGKVQYEAYYIMRWLGEIGGPKCGGGWFDWLGTTEKTYLEQANQTILAGSREMLLFCYGGLQSSTGPANVVNLRKEMPGLFELARLIKGKPIRGVAAPKPAGSDSGKEAYVFDFVGMMGIPLVPTATIDPKAAATIYPVHVLKDAQFGEKLKAMLTAGKPVLITDGLAEKVGAVEAGGNKPVILKIKGEPKSLLEITREQLAAIRGPLLKPFGLSFDAPNKVALYLFGEDLIAVENFNDESVSTTLQFEKAVKIQKRLVIPAGGEGKLTEGEKQFQLDISPRTLVMIQLDKM